MIRVAINAVPMFTPLTGIGSYTFHLSQALQKIDALSLSFFYANYWSDRLIRNPILPHYGSMKRIIRDFVPFAYTLNRNFQQFHFSFGRRKRACDIYHETNFLAFRFNGPTVITVHDLSWIRHPETHPKQRVLAMEKYFEKGLRRASHVITDSNFIKNEIVDVFGVNTENITAIPLGVSELFKPLMLSQKKPKLSELGLSNRKYFLLLGTLEPRKNISTVLDAFLSLPKKTRKIYPLVIVGMKGWHTTALEKKLDPLLQSGAVRVLGYLNHLDLRQVIAGSLSLIYPSIYEGFGLPPLEAMASGVPVIASNISSIPEVVGDSGILVDPYDIGGFSEAMRMMIESKDVHSFYTAKGLVRAQEFSWDKTAIETYGVYLKALS